MKYIFEPDLSNVEGQNVAFVGFLYHRNSRYDHLKIYAEQINNLKSSFFQFRKDILS